MSGSTSMVREDLDEDGLSEFNLYEELLGESQCDSLQASRDSSEKDGDEEHSSMDLTDFSDEEVLLDKDDLFCDSEDIVKVKIRVEESLSGLNIFEDSLLSNNVFEPHYESDGLLTASESSDNEHMPKNKHRFFNEKVDFRKTIELDKGLQFRNKNVFIKALKYCAVMKGFDYYYQSNRKGKVSAHCKVSHCPWRVYASWFIDETGSKSFMIKTWIPHKDCQRQFHNSKVTVKFLTEHYLEGFRNNPKWDAPSFFRHVKDDLEVNVSHMKCFRARQEALKIINGSAGEQYKLLRQYCGALLKSNPGSSILLMTNGGHFQRIYLCFDACKRGLLLGCRAIISLDSCHLRGQYKGQIHSAVGRDANDNMFPIAWVVCETENKETWTWFLQNLMNDIDVSSQYDWCFISDQQKGLQEALKDVMPTSEHRSCVRHIYANFKKKFKGKELKDAMWAAARASTKGQFSEKMMLLKALDHTAHLHMTTFDPKVWSKHAFKSFSKCDALCSNISECFNAYIKEAREQPIITCLETIRMLLMKRFQEKYVAMINYEHEIMPRTLRKLMEHKKDSFHWQVTWNGRGNGFQVDRNLWDRHVVDLESYTCDCNLWDFTGIPCVHACAAIFHINGNPDNYVHHSLRKENFIKAYEASISAMPGPTEWLEVEGDIILPPIFRKQPGRPRKKRIRSPDESINCNSVGRRYIRIKCSICGKVGHNRRSCSNEPSDPKKAMAAEKDAERKKFARQLKKTQYLKPAKDMSNFAQPKKPKDRTKCKKLQQIEMRESQSITQTPPLRQWITGYATLDSVESYKALESTGPVYINEGLFTRPNTFGSQNKYPSKFQVPTSTHDRNN